MYRLRTSVLLRRSDRVVSAGLLVAAQALFLWMFLSVDPIETALGSERALAFAAAWRHGMAGNAWLYMPGFFATAAATWLYAGTASAFLLRDLAALVTIAAISAALAFPVGLDIASADFVAVTALALPDRLPRFTALAFARALYTLVTWSVFVIACRRALVGCSWRPFVLPAMLTIGLILIRPWTVDDFTSRWGRGIVEADVVACGSAAAAIGLGALLGMSVQRSQSRSNRRCATGIRRAETTNTR